MSALFSSIHPEVIRGLRREGMTRYWVERERFIPPLEGTFVGQFAGADCMTDADNLAAKADIEYGVDLARFVSYVWLFERVAIACRKPIELHVDDGYRPHNSSGPAMVFKGEKDNWKCWSWHGTPIPKKIIEEPDSIKISDIDNEINTEYRRILLERFGVARYLQETHAQEITSDNFGTLFRIQGEVLLRVVNKTAEPNGDFKEYFLRVPPEMTSAREAVAWTFNLSGDQYFPTIES